jgi:hypothetical protein
LNKKQIPHDILTVVELILKANSDIIANKKEDNCYYSIYDREEGSTFYFKIYIDYKKVNPQSNPDYNKHLFCCMSPTSSTVLTPAVIAMERRMLGDNIQGWLKIVRAYNEAESVYDDPFLKTYQEYYYSEFKSVDDDADTSPFNPAQQEVIERYLLQVGQKLLEFRETSESPHPIDEIIADIKETVDELSVSTKNQVASRISRIMAKVFKWKKGIANDFYKKAKEEIITTVIREGAKRLTGAIEVINDNIDKLS